MKKNLTELVFVIDMSGSMQPLTRDTIGGFNSVLEEQRGREGEVLVSTVLFNHESQVLHDRVNIDQVKPMTQADYRAGGSTALIDALGGAVHHIGNVHKYARAEDVPEHTLFVITTDGMENASHRYSAEQVRRMIRRQQEKYGWEFIFLGANIDAVETAQTYGIRPERAVNYHNDARGTEVKFRAMNMAISGMRRDESLDTCAWSVEAIEDYEKRKK